MRKVRDYYAQEVEFLTSCGARPPAIAELFGIRATSLAQALYREGRSDLARPFWSLGRDSNPKHPCMDCGALVTRKAARCMPCATARRAAA